MKFTATFVAAAVVATFHTVASVTAIDVTCIIDVVPGFPVPVSGTLDGPGVDSICGGVVEHLDGISFGGSLGGLAPSITIARDNGCPAGSIACTTACSNGMTVTICAGLLASAA